MESGGGVWPAVRRQGKRLVVWLVALLLVLASVGIVVVDSPYRAIEGSVEAVEDDDRVTLSRIGGGYLLKPANAEPTAGVVFYPGALVHPDAYVASLAPLVAAGNVTVVTPRMPLHLAIVDYGAARTPLWEDRATAAMDRQSSVDRWYVGGHSLGGAIACRYAETNAGDVSGLILYGAYCDRSISGTDLAVLSVTGRGDTVLNRDADDRNLDNLPEDATVVELPGLNHTQFGSYTGQSGDSPTGTSYETAHERLNAVVVPWLQNETAG
jgi:hypothetical protein